MKRLQSVQIFPLYSGAKVQNHFDLQIKVPLFYFYKEKFNTTYYFDRVIEINLFFVWLIKKMFAHLHYQITEKMKLTVCNMSCMMPEPSAETIL